MASSHPSVFVLVPLYIDMLVGAMIMYLAAATVGVLRFRVAMSGLLSMLLWCRTTSAIAPAWGAYCLRCYLLATMAAIAAEGGDAVFYVPLGVLGCVLLSERKIA